MKLFSFLKEYLPSRMAVVFVENEIRYTPPDCLLHGECWLSLWVDKENLMLSLLDVTLEYKEIEQRQMCQVAGQSYGWPQPGRPWRMTSMEEAAERVVEELLVCGRKIDSIDNYDSDLFSYQEKWRDYVYMKFVQAVDCRKFFTYLDILEKDNDLDGDTLDNLAWILARQRGEEFVRVMKNREAALEIL